MKICSRLLRSKTISTASAAIEQTLSSQVANHTVSLEMGRDGLVISLREAGFFDSGSAAPKPEALPTLRQIAAQLGATPYDLRIEGHTDNMPIHNAEFDSNWELSSARATRIARLFLDMKAILPTAFRPPAMPNFIPWPAMTPPKAARKIAASIWSSCRARKSTLPRPAHAASALAEDYGWMSEQQSQRASKSARAIALAEPEFG